MKKHIESSICKGLGIGESLHCFTPFHFIAIWGLGLGNCFIASLRSASSQFGEGGWGIASLLHSVPLHRDLGVGVGESLHCFTPFRFIAIWGRGLGNRFIASLRSASSQFGEGEGVSLKPSPGNQVQLYPHMEAVCRYIIWKQSISQKETSPLAHFVRNSLPHKSFRFCSPMRSSGNRVLVKMVWYPQVVYY